MNLDSVLLWGFMATTLLTSVLGLGQALGLTRIDLPLLLGVGFTSDRDSAKIVGFVMHFLIGWLAAFVYAAVFGSIHLAAWWIGGLLGVLHGVFVLVIVPSLLPAIHPRMATEQQGPTHLRQLEPPGPLGIHYGQRTPLVVLAAHIAYGVLLGTFYRLP